MDPLVHNRDQGTIETVDCSWQTCSKESEDCPIGRKGDGHRWDSQGVIYIDYLENGKTVTGLYYAKLLDRFDAKLQIKRPHLAKQSALLPWQCTGWHLCHRQAKLHYKLLPHPLYSPDLTPCDFYLFPNLKKSLAGQKFELSKEVIAAMEAYFADLEKTFFRLVKKTGASLG